MYISRWPLQRGEQLVMLTENIVTAPSRNIFFQEPRQFNTNSLGVNLTLFRTYCSPTVYVYSTAVVELK